MSELRVRQVRSSIGTKPKHRGTLRALGLGRIGKTHTLPDRPEIRGMIAKVPHLVTVEEADATTATPVKKAAAAKTTTEKAPAKKAPAKKAPAKKAPAEAATTKAPAKKAAAKAPAKKAAATKKAPAKKAAAAKKTATKKAAAAKKTT
jgi:ribosomal protein L30